MLYHWTQKIQAHIEPGQCIAVELTSFTRGPTVYTGSKNQWGGIWTTAQASHKPTSEMKKIWLYSFYITACIPTLRYLELNTIIHYKLTTETNKNPKMWSWVSWIFISSYLRSCCKLCLFYTVILKLIFLKCNYCNECWWKKSVTVHHWHWLIRLSHTFDPFPLTFHDSTQTLQYWLCECREAEWDLWFKVSAKVVKCSLLYFVLHFPTSVAPSVQGFGTLVIVE